MGASPKCTKCVEKLHGNFNAVLKVGNIEIEIEHGHLVRQDDNVTPSLLIIVMQLVAGGMLAELKDSNTDTINIKHRNANRKMKLHELKDMMAVTKKESVTC